MDQIINHDFKSQKLSKKYPTVQNDQGKPRNVSSMRKVTGITHKQWCLIIDKPLEEEDDY